MSDLKCNMKCFECIFRDCTQNTGLTPEESKAIFTWLPEEAKSRGKYKSRKRCGTCKYHQHEDITDGWICVNDESEHLADWTMFDDTCEDWEER